MEIIESRIKPARVHDILGHPYISHIKIGWKDAVGAINVYLFSGGKIGLDWKKNNKKDIRRV